MANDMRRIFEVDEQKNIKATESQKKEKDMNKGEIFLKRQNEKNKYVKVTKTQKIDGNIIINTVTIGGAD